MTSTFDRTHFRPGRFALIAIAIVALLGVTAAAGFNATAADAGQNFTAQAKKKCKKKRGVAKKKCIHKTVKKLKKKAKAKARARAKAKRNRGKVGFMTRNVYLGADLGPAIRAANLQAFVDANGEIMRQVDTNNFPVRAKGLAGEIISKSPDLVGLQEVALWRTGEAGPPHNKPTDPESSFTSKTVKYDYLKLLMNQLNKGKKRYRVVKVTTEFDFEGPANYDGDENGIGEIDGRLTMRDVILAKVGKDIQTRNTAAANYTTHFAPVISGFNVTVDRGWGSVEAKVRNSSWFKFVNTHLESFGDDKNKVTDCMTTPDPQYLSNQVSIRCRQAKELYDTAIAPSNVPVVLTGDLNSDDNTVIDANCPSAANTDDTLPGNNGGQCGDTFAYNALASNGMVDLSTESPLGCCLNTEVLTDNFGSITDFDHHIDHIMTNKPARVKKLNSSVTGRTPVNGYWDSDHAGVYSLLRINP